MWMACEEHRVDLAMSNDFEAQLPENGDFFLKGVCMGST